MKTPATSTILSVIRKDLRAEMRSRELVNTMVLFAFLSVLVFSFALELDLTARREVVSGVLWVTILFASILGLNRSMTIEREQGGLDAMMLAPVDRAALYFGKTTGNFIFTLLVGLVLLPVMTLLYNITLVQPLMFITLILGALGLAAVGTLLATMTAQTRARETLLPIIMLPTALPVLLTVVRASAGIMDGQVDYGWIVTLAMIDLMYLTLGLLLFEYVIED